jgi:hypothetical protein
MALLNYLRFAGEYWLGLALAGIALYLARNKYYHGLHVYPGPWLAAYTNWWRLSVTLRGTAEQTHIGLHKRHGDIVRLGPDTLSFASPGAIKDIYGLNRGITKARRYPDFCFYSLFTARTRRANEAVLEIVKLLPCSAGYCQRPAASVAILDG